MSPRSSRAGRERARRDGRRRLVHREVRLLLLRRAASTATQPSFLAPAAPGVRGRVGPHDRAPTTAGGPTATARSWHPASTPASTRICASTDAGLVAPRRTTTPPGRRCASAPRPGPATRTCRCPRRASRPPVRAHRDAARRRGAHRRPRAACILDFGQNLVGRLRLRVAGPRAHAITVRHAEVLDDGELALRPLRNAASDRRVRPRRRRRRDRWSRGSRSTGSGTPQIDGWPGEFDPADVEAVVLHTDMTRTGWFESSDALLDRLHENVVWGMRGNFLSIPTDCPQRDERLGWTGDLQVFSADGELPVRLRRVPHVVAARPRARAGAQRRQRAARRARGAPGLRRPGRRRPRGAMPRPSPRGCCTSASATSAC